MILDSYGNRRFYGIYRGIVVSNADPLNKGRVKVQIPQILAKEITDWAWVKDANGVRVNPPKIGQGVWIQFEGGDPSFPVLSGTFGVNQNLLNLSLDGLSDVDTAGVTNGQVIKYQSSTSSWIPGAGGSVTSITAGTNLTGGTITSAGTIALSATPTGVTSINGVTLPTSGSFITSATTSLPNVTSVNSTTIPASSTLVTTSDTGSVTSTMLLDGTVVNADINASAAIAASKISGTAVTLADTGTVTNTMLAGSIANSKLSNSSITFGSTSQALGSTISNIAGVTINSTTIPSSATLLTSSTSAGGDLTGTYPNPTLATSGVTLGSYGSASAVAAFTVDAKGRLTAASNTTIEIAPSAVTGTAVITTDSRLSDARTPTAHVHSSDDITSGTLLIARGGTGVSTGAGLVPIIPTSVSSTGGSVSFSSSTGKITATGNNTAIVVNGVFSSTYTNYRIVINDTAGGDYMSFRSVNSSGTVNTTSTAYNWQNIGAQAGNIYYGSGFFASLDSRFQMSAMDANFSARSFDVYAPFSSSTRTSIAGNGRWGASGAPTAWTFAGSMNSTATTAGFQLFVPSGTFAATIMVYGYRE